MMVANASPHLVCHHHAHRLFDIDILTTLRDHTMRDEDGTHTTSVAKNKRKRLTVLNALCLNATGLHLETNADAKKKTPSRQQRLLYSCRDAAPYHHQPNVPMKNVGVHGSTVALAMLLLDPNAVLATMFSEH